MEIVQPSSAGTLESSDVQVTVLPNDTLEITIESDVIRQYGNHINRLVRKTLERFSVQSGEVRIVDKGALDCTIEARLQTALHRSAGKTVPEKWGM